MSESAARGEHSYSNTAALRVAVGPLAAPLVCRVVSIVAARADCPVDRLDDALLICDAIGAHAVDHVPNGHLDVTVQARHDGLQLRIGPLRREGARRVISDADVPGIGNVLEQVADGLSVEDLPDGEILVIDLGF